LRWNPNSVDAHLLLGELLLMEQRFSEAEERFLKVLQEYNAENRRAVKGLFETYAASKRYDEAREMLGRLSAFNPLNPYLDFYRARFEAARGDFYEAGLALDRLEAAGLRGSVAILLYHGLVESDYFIDALSVRRFRDHLTALRDAGFRVVRVQDIPDVLDGLSAGTDPSPTDGTGILVAIDFDDARKDSMRFATPIAREFQWPFSMNVPVGYIEMNHPFICSWDELRHYKATGVWSYGSHFLNAAILVPTGPGGQLGRPLPNRVWQPGLQSLESTELYVARLSDEFIQSRVVLERQLGAPVDVISYPFGDIGQEDITNLEGTSLRIVEAGSQTYRVGLIQSEFGYAVHGDNPLLYQRHEMDRWTGGTNLIQHLYASHPVLLARRLRAEFAALAGKRHEARLSLRQLEEARYPEPLLNPVADYVHRRMARKFATPGADDLDDSRSVFELRPDKPYIGGRGSYFEDNQGRRNWQILGLGGFHITPYISMEGKGGIGNLRQDSTEDGRAALDIDETVVGASLNVLLPTGGFITGEALQRDFSEPADAVLARSVEGHFRPFYLTDILLRYEHDIAPSAQAAVEDIQYDALMGLGIFSLRDWWDLSASGMFYDFSDDNTRDHLMLGTTWLLAERTGLKLGLRYMFTTSDFESDAYWTPYRLQRYFIETSLQGNYLRHYYNARIRFGLGREGTRPERIEQRRELEDRARRLRFDPGPPDEKEGWEPVFGLMLSTRLRFGEYWMIHGELSYNRVPNYEELHLLGEIRYSF
ncbi:MAG: tetratricopeptide repeat protein, partial [Kiritimatiellia bacterium]|nr:tetratricopeptide repeat protein [Kiritimatiellia bacterium]